MSVLAVETGSGLDNTVVTPQTDVIQNKYSLPSLNVPDLDFDFSVTKFPSYTNGLESTYVPEIKMTAVKYDGIPVMNNKSDSHKPAMIDPMDLQLTNEILFSIRQKIHGMRDGVNDIHFEQQATDDIYGSVKVKMEENLCDVDLKSYNLLNVPGSESQLQSNDFQIKNSPSPSVLPNFTESLNNSLYVNSDSTISDMCPVESQACQSADKASKRGLFNSPSLHGSGYTQQTCSDGESMFDSSASSPVEKTSLKPSSHTLPPCRVCGDKASGFHYGANTCEACKGFFRRSLKKDKTEYKCTGDNDCVIQKGRRNNCTLCRYNKCLNVGMSKNAIKTGRYTHEKRTKDILEVNTLQGKPGPHFLQPSFSKTDWLSTRPRKTLSDKNKLLLDTIYTAHQSIFPLLHKTLSTGWHKVLSKKYSEKYKMEKSARVASPSCSDSQRVDSLDSTDTHQEKSNLPVKKEEKDNSEAIDNITQHLELAIMAFVRYAKAVPGFTDLPLNDQATLVKLSRFEIWMVSAHQFFDVDLEIVSGPRGKSYHLDELGDIIDKGFVRSLFNFAQSMQEINLTMEETAILKCIVLTFSDRGNLQESGKVDDIQLVLVNCLEEMMDNGVRFAKVMNSLIRLRDLTEWNKQIARNMLSGWPTLKQYPLLVEIMSL